MDRKKKPNNNQLQVPIEQEDQEDDQQSSISYDFEGAGEYENEDEIEKEEGESPSEAEEEPDDDEIDYNKNKKYFKEDLNQQNKLANEDEEEKKFNRLSDDDDDDEDELEDELLDKQNVFLNKQNSNAEDQSSKSSIQKSSPFKNQKSQDNGEYAQTDKNAFDGITKTDLIDQAQQSELANQIKSTSLKQVSITDPQQQQELNMIEKQQSPLQTQIGDLNKSNEKKKPYKYVRKSLKKKAAILQELGDQQYSSDLSEISDDEMLRLSLKYGTDYNERFLNSKPRTRAKEMLKKQEKMKANYRKALDSKNMAFPSNVPIYLWDEQGNKFFCDNSQMQVQKGTVEQFIHQNVLHEHNNVLSDLVRFGGIYGNPYIKRRRRRKKKYRTGDDPLDSDPNYSDM